jgi:predicted aldo/keto reductase-like oxidoreductase
MVYKAGTARARRRKEERTVNKVRLVESLFNEAIEQLEAEGFDCYGDSELKSNHFESEEAGLG